MEEGTKPVTREALYEEIWAEPVTVVAKRYGMSDVGLVKICKKLSIPVPGRGYWAKVKAGHAVRKLPLPASSPSAGSRHGPRPLTEREAALRARVQDARANAMRSQAGISVTPALEDPHPLVKAAAARLKQREGWDHPAGVRSAPKEVLDIQVTRSSLDRALRLMDTLLKSLEHHGVTASVNAVKGETLLDVSGTALSLSIAEQVSRTSHTPTPKEVRARNRYYESFRAGTREDYPSIPQFDWHATGRLTVTVGSWSVRRWNDTDRSLVERRLPTIVLAIIALAEEQRTKEAEQERRQRAYRDARTQYEEQVSRRHAERNEVRALFRNASRFERASRLRQFITAVADHARMQGELTAEKQQWIEWARAKADWIDPLISVSDPILDAPEPEAPNAWLF